MHELALVLAVAIALGLVAGRRFGALRIGLASALIFLAGMTPLGHAFGTGLGEHVAANALALLTFQLSALASMAIPAGWLRDVARLAEGRSGDQARARH